MLNPHINLKVYLLKYSAINGDFIENLAIGIPKIKFYFLRSFYKNHLFNEFFIESKLLYFYELYYCKNLLILIIILFKYLISKNKILLLPIPVKNNKTPKSAIFTL